MNNDVKTNLQTLIDICHANLKKSSECMEYLAKRKISLEYINKYKLGYFPQNILTLEKFVSEKVLQDLRIIDYTNQSKFATYFYLIFPLISEYQEPLGISGRTLMSDVHRNFYKIAKYENSSFKKANFLYGLNNSRLEILKQQNVFIVEGNFDQIAFDQNGIKNTVAICGTSFTDNHFLKLARYSKRMTFILDRDDGGENSMNKIYSKYCNKGIQLRFRRLPEEFKDIDEYFSSGKTIENFHQDIKDFVPGW